MKRLAARAKDTALDDERVEINVDGTTLLGADGHDQDSDDGDDLLPPNGIKPFTQRDLVAEAFAGDNVVEVSKHPDPPSVLTQLIV